MRRVRERPVNLRSKCPAPPPGALWSRHRRYWEPGSADLKPFDLRRSPATTYGSVGRSPEQALLSRQRTCRPAATGQPDHSRQRAAASYYGLSSRPRGAGGCVDACSQTLGAGSPGRAVCFAVLHHHCAWTDNARSCGRHG